MKSAAAALLSSLVIFAPRVSTGQTLDELQYPLLAKGKAAVSADYVNFAIQGQFVTIGSPTYTYFHPYSVLLPTIAVGIRDNLQLTVDATYQFPTLYSDPSFVDPATYARNQQRIRSLLAALTFRPSPGIEVAASYLSGRSEYNLLYTRNPATIASHVETYNTDLVQIRGT
jgi:hypothetical protein